MKSRFDRPMRYHYINGLFSPALMNQLLVDAESHGFGNATYADGSHRDNVKTFFFNKREHGRVASFAQVLRQIQQDAKPLSEIFGVETYPKKLDYIQVARYLPGDYYGPHVDHETSLRHIEFDRKLSLFVGMSPGAVVRVEGNDVWCGPGDGVVFPSTMHHEAPEQREGSRYSFVAWIPGPSWK